MAYKFYLGMKNRTLPVRFESSRVIVGSELKITQIKSTDLFYIPAVQLIAWTS